MQRYVLVTRIFFKTTILGWGRGHTNFYTKSPPDNYSGSILFPQKRVKYWKFSSGRKETGVGSGIVRQPGSEWTPSLKQAAPLSTAWCLSNVPTQSLQGRGIPAKMDRALEGQGLADGQKQASSEQLISSSY